MFFSSPGRYSESLLDCVAQDRAGTTRTGYLCSLFSIATSLRSSAHLSNDFALISMYFFPYLRAICGFSLRCACDSNPYYDPAHFAFRGSHKQTTHSRLFRDTSWTFEQTLRAGCTRGPKRLSEYVKNNDICFIRYHIFKRWWRQVSCYVKPLNMVRIERLM